MLENSLYFLSIFFQFKLKYLFFFFFFKAGKSSLSFENEVLIMKSVSHPNLIKLEEVYESKKVIVFFFYLKAFLFFYYANSFFNDDDSCFFIFYKNRNYT